jgi:hypothetical protein
MGLFGGPALSIVHNMKESSIKKIVKKAVAKIHEEHVEPGDTIPKRVRFCFFDSRSMFIPGIVEIPGDGPYRGRVNASDLIRETDRRLRAGKKLFSGVIVYDPRRVSHKSETWMCPLLKNTFNDLKAKDKKFHCIMATSGDSYLEYRKHKGEKE